VRAAIATFVITAIVLLALMYWDGRMAESSPDAGQTPSATVVTPGSPDPSSKDPAGSSYFLQLDSTSDYASVRSIVQSDTDRWSTLVGLPLEVYTVTRSDGSKFYRIGKTVPDRATLQSLCVQVKARGGDCLTLVFGG
jgi:hypothetical protein